MEPYKGYPFSKEFKNTGETFSSLHAAEKWLRDNDYSFGPLCGPEPVGCVKGDALISKWRNLSAEDKTQMDCVITSSNYRNEDVYIHFKEEP